MDLNCGGLSPGRSVKLFSFNELLDRSHFLYIIQHLDIYIWRCELSLPSSKIVVGNTNQKSSNQNDGCVVHIVSRDGHSEWKHAKNDDQLYPHHGEYVDTVTKALGQ